MKPTQTVETKDSGCQRTGVSAMPVMEPVLSIEILPTPDLIARYRRGVENFDRRLFALTAEQIDTAFLPGSGVGTWPVRVLLGHLADADLAQAHRIRRAVGEDHPVLSLWDANSFIDHDVYGLRAGPKDLDTAARDHQAMTMVGGCVALIHTVRQWTGQWLGTLSEKQWVREALHPERGPVSIRTMTAIMTWHLEHHARYLRAKLDVLVGPEEKDAEGGCGHGCGCGRNAAKHEGAHKPE